MYFNVCSFDVCARLDNIREDTAEVDDEESI